MLGESWEKLFEGIRQDTHLRPYLLFCGFVVDHQILLIHESHLTSYNRLRKLTSLDYQKKFFHLRKTHLCMFRSFLGVWRCFCKSHLMSHFLNWRTLLEKCFHVFLYSTLNFSSFPLLFNFVPKFIFFLFILNLALIFLAQQNQ